MDGYYNVTGTFDAALHTEVAELNTLIASFEAAAPGIRRRFAEAMDAGDPVALTFVKSQLQLLLGRLDSGLAGLELTQVFKGRMHGSALPTTDTGTG